MRKTDMCHKETFPKETKKDGILLTMDKESLYLPPAVEVVVSGEETFSSFQDILEPLTHRVSCMTEEMHEEEDENSNTGTLGEEQPSLLPAVGGTIVPVGGTLVFLQEVSTHQLIQGM